MDKKILKALFERIDILEEKIDMNLCKGCNLGFDGSTYYACPIHGNGRDIYENLEKRKERLKDEIGD